MKILFLQLAAGALLMANVAHASEIKLQTDSNKIRFNHFDGSESLSEFTLWFKQRDNSSAGISHYKIPAPANGGVTSTLCISMFEADRVETSGLFTKKRTLHYNRTEFNAFSDSN
jgi:hypothetical protein